MISLPRLEFTIHLLIKDKKSTLKKLKEYTAMLANNFSTELKNPETKALITIGKDNKSSIDYAMENKKYGMLEEILRFKNLYDPLYEIRGLQSSFHFAIKSDFYKSIKVMANTKSIDLSDKCLFTECNKRAGMLGTFSSFTSFEIFNEILLDYAIKNYPKSITKFAFLAIKFFSAEEYKTLVNKIPSNLLFINAWSNSTGNIFDRFCDSWKGTRLKKLEYILSKGANPNLLVPDKPDYKNIIDTSVTKLDFETLQVLLSHSQEEIKFSNASIVSLEEKITSCDNALLKKLWQASSSHEKNHKEDHKENHKNKNHKNKKLRAMLLYKIANIDLKPLAKELGHEEAFKIIDESNDLYTEIYNTTSSCIDRYLMISSLTHYVNSSVMSFLYPSLVPKISLAKPCLSADAIKQDDECNKSDGISLVKQAAFSAKIYKNS